MRGGDEWFFHKHVALTHVQRAEVTGCASVLILVPCILGMLCFCPASVQKNISSLRDVAMHFFVVVLIHLANAAHASVQ